MLETYRAILLKDRVEWQDEAPKHDHPVHVHVTVLDRVAADADQSRGQAMAEALQRIADRGGLAGIADPAAWQREVRRDRPLPGRDE